MNKKHTKALKTLSAVLDGVKVKAAKPLIGPSADLQKAVTTQTTTSYLGWINHAGRVVDGTYQVQFDMPGTGWSSRWPQWAYEPALAALVNRKRVWLITTGEPFGPNLLQVLVTNQDV